MRTQISIKETDLGEEPQRGEIVVARGFNLWKKDGKIEVVFGRLSVNRERMSRQKQPFDKAQGPPRNVPSGHPMGRK